MVQIGRDDRAGLLLVVIIFQGETIKGIALHRNMCQPSNRLPPSVPPFFEHVQKFRVFIADGFHNGLLIRHTGDRDLRCKGHAAQIVTVAAPNLQTVRCRNVRASVRPLPSRTDYCERYRGSKEMIASVPTSPAIDSPSVNPPLAYALTSSPPNRPPTRPFAPLYRLPMTGMLSIFSFSQASFWPIQPKKLPLHSLPQ